MLCRICRCDLVIRLDADYASSGMWCGVCGVCYSNPKLAFPQIPPALVDLVDGWNLMWEMAMDDKQLSRPHFDHVFRTMGLELARQVNEYVPCFFDDELPVYY